jgi:outer membrane protein assembly factor BamB
MMTEIIETVRHPAPGPEPLGLAFDGTTMWVSSREAHRLYAMDPSTWTVRVEVQAPGAPFGIAVVGDELAVVIGHGNDDDDRYIYRFVPGNGFKTGRMQCPDLSGVHLAFDGDTLFLSQAHNRRILALDRDGMVLREMQLDRVPLGMTILDGVFYLVTGAKNFKNLELTKMDARGETPQVTSLASIPFVARGLAFDGSRFWTAQRDTNEIVAFTMPAP